MLRKILSFLSTRVGISLLVALLVIGIATIIKTRGDSAVTEKGPAALAVEKLIKKSLEDDTDGDTLKNWEEALYKTDPENADTDGDGVHDGAEITANRNPLVVGVGDSTSSTTSGTAIQFSATDRFSQELFVKYLEAKQSGKEITTELANQIAEEVLAKDYSGLEQTFEESQLATLVTPSITAIKAYGNEFGRAISIPRSPDARSEIAIIDSVMSAGMTDTDRAELETIRLRYQKIRDNLARIQVPEDAKSIHASFIRSVDLLKEAVVGIETIESDPIGSLKKIAFFEDGINNLTVASVALKTYFIKKSISFEPYESGASLMR